MSEHRSSPDHRVETPSPFPALRQPSRDMRAEFDGEDPEQTGPHSPVQETTAERALRIGLELRHQFGAPAVPLTKKPATGIYAVLEDLTSEVKGISSNVNTVLTSLATGEKIVNRRMGFIALFGEKVISALIPLIIVGVFAYLTGHLRWDPVPTSDARATVINAGTPKSPVVPAAVSTSSASAGGR